MLMIALRTAAATAGETRVEAGKETARDGMATPAPPATRTAVTGATNERPPVPDP
jgi:hypothetical protein